MSLIGKTKAHVLIVEALITALTELSQRLEKFDAYGDDSIANAADPYYVVAEGNLKILAELELSDVDRALVTEALQHLESSPAWQKFPDSSKMLRLRMLFHSLLPE